MGSVLPGASASLYDPAMTVTPSTHAVSQYATTTGNLTTRMALHAYGSNPGGWFSWLERRLPLAGDVLDIGAGTGELWSHIDHGRRIVMPHVVRDPSGGRGDDPCEALLRQFQDHTEGDGQRRRSVQARCPDVPGTWPVYTVTRDRNGDGAEGL